jgi:tight adherence protein B
LIVTEVFAVHPALLMLLTFLAVVMAIAGGYSIFSDLYLRDRSRISQRVDDELRRRQRERAQRSELFKNLAPMTPESAEGMEPAPTVRQRLEALLEQSGLDLSVERLLLIVAGVGLGLGLIAGLVRQSIFIGVIGALVGAALPFLYVLFKRQMRLEKMLSQLPDSFDLMARAIRAGQTTAQALLAVADEFEPPIAAEFAYCYEQQNLGLSSEVAMRDLARRTGLLEIKIFVLALLVQQQTGGNLAELLEKLATLIRERYRLRGKIRALTAEGKFQAGVLLALPPALFGIIMILNRDYAVILFQYPWLLGGMIIAEVLGALWIRKIINIDY